MAGLRKAKKYDWKDSNLALFGSDLEKNVKRAAAETEEAWKGAGQKVGIQVWRIVKFEVKEWHKEDYGKFYQGDSYIILHTYKKPDEDDFEYDLFFWIGKYSTQDEYGTAAYKTVELDTFLHDKPVQHREVMGHESALFKKLFPMITLMKGGADSGFRHVKPKEYKPRLLKISGDRKSMSFTEVKLDVANTNNEDAFILDRGLDVFFFFGTTSNKDERFKGVQYMQQLKSERGGKGTFETVDSLARFQTEMSKCNNVEEDDDDDDEDNVDAGEQDSEPVLFKLSDESGDLKFTEQKTGQIGQEDFKSEDAYVLDTKKGLFVWIGKDTSQNEKKQAMQYAHHYLMKTDKPFIPVTCIKEGRESRDFKSAIAA